MLEDSDNMLDGKLGLTSRHISVLRAFDMFLHYHVGNVFSVWPIEIGIFLEKRREREGNYFDRKYRVCRFKSWVWLKR